MNNKLIIGFGGLKFSGKTTAAKTLKRIFAEEAVVMSFATPLKEMCSMMFNLSWEQMTDPVLKEQVDYRYGMSPRQIMQKVGWMFREFFGKDFWVKKLEHAILEIPNKVIVIDDVRRNNEANICKYLFMIHRKDLINDDPDESENPPYHLSFCDIINDCPTVEDFKHHVRGGLATRIIQEYIHANKN